MVTGFYYHIYGTNAKTREPVFEKRHCLNEKRETLFV